MTYSLTYSLRDALWFQNACFFIKFIKGGESNPFIKILTQIWCVMKKSEKSEKTEKSGGKAKKTLITLSKREGGGVKGHL